MDFAEANEFSLVTNDKRTMPGHIAAHYAKGAHTLGVFIIRNRAIAHSRIVDELLLIWATTEVSEWIDLSQHIPL